MFNNNGFNGAMGMMGGIPQGTGYQFMGNQQPLKIQNNLSQEEIKQLIKQENNFSLAITQEDRLRACCNHRWDNGQDAIVETPEGLCRCNICGHVFNPLDASTSPEALQEYVTNILDVLQTIKMLYINMPAESAREFFVIIPLIEKIPKLFEHAVKNYAKYDNFDPYRYNDKNMGTMALFNMLAQSLNNGAGYVAPQQQMAPQMDPSMGMMGGMPQMNPAMGMPMMGGMPGANPFGYNGAPGYQPQMSGYQYDPTQVQQQMAAGQVAPADAKATTDGQNVSVDAQFKA